MSDRPQFIYNPIEYVGIDEWNSSRRIRVKRLSEIVHPKLRRNLEELDCDPDAVQFTRHALGELGLICQTEFTNQGNPPSEIPVYCMMDEEARNISTYNLNGVRGRHNVTTLITTQSLVDAFCPEFDISLAADSQTLIQKAGRAQLFGYADLYSRHTNDDPDMVEFSTVLPNVTLGISFHGQEKYISLDWKVM